jgi:hypothetical protein
MSLQGQYAWSSPGQQPDWYNMQLRGGVEGPCLKDLSVKVSRPGMIGFDLGCGSGWTASHVIPTFMEHNGRFHLVDWFCGNVNTEVGGSLWNQEYPSRQRLLQVLANLECLGLKNWTVTVGTTLDLSASVANESCDYIYIGGDHRYSKIKADIETWLPKLRDGGVMVGHGWDGDADLKISKPDWDRIWSSEELDLYYEFGAHLGINRAIRELLPGFATCGNLWFWFKPSKT